MGRPERDPGGTSTEAPAAGPAPSWVRHLARAASTLVLASGVYFLYLIASHHPRDLPLTWRCPFFTLTSVRCPGCGLTRATHYVFQGELGVAIDLNPLILIVPLVLGWTAFVLGFVIIKGRPPQMPGPPTAVGWAIFALLMGFWLYRIVVDVLALAA